MDFWTSLRQKPPLSARLDPQHPLARKLLACWLCQDGGGPRLYDTTRRYPGTISYAGGLSWGRAKRWGGHALASAATAGTAGVSLSGLPALTRYAIEAVLVSQGSDTYGTILVDSAGNIGLWLHQSSGEKLDFFSGTDHHSTASLVAGVPYHIVVTSRGTAAMDYYINGVLDSSQSFTVPSFTPAVLLNDTVSDTFIGTLEFVRLYNADLTAAEVQDLYRRPLAMLDPPTTLLWQGALFVPSSGGQGSVSTTLAPLTLSATGQLERLGSVTATLDPLTLSATGTLALTGSVTTTLDPLTLAATGALAVQGSLSTTLDALTLAATGTGTLTTMGSLAVTLAPLTLSASGTLAITGSLTATLSAWTLTATAQSSIHVGLDLVMGNAVFNMTLFQPELSGSTAWLEAAAHGATLAQESGAYAPVYLIDFLDYDLTIGTHEVPFETSTTFRSDLARLLDGGIGAITRELDEMADVIRLGGTSLRLLYTDELRLIFAARPLEMTKVRIRLGFEDLEDAIDYNTIFSGTVDRITRTIEYWDLTLIDDSVAQDRNLSVPLAPPLFPQAPPASQSLNIPIVVGVVTGMILPQVAGGAAAGTLAFPMDDFQQELWMPETEVIWPATGTITVGGESMTYETQRETAVAGVPYRNLQGLVRSSPVAHAAGVAVTLISTEATHVLGWGVHTVNAVYKNGDPLDGSDVDITSIEVLGRVVPLVIILVPFDPDTDIISADVNADAPVLVDVPWVEELPEPPPGEVGFETGYFSSFAAGGTTGGVSNATIVEEHSPDPMYWTFTNPPDDPIVHEIGQVQNIGGTGYLLQVLANAPDVWGETYQQGFALQIGASYEVNFSYKLVQNPFGTTGDQSFAAYAMGTAANPALYSAGELALYTLPSGTFWSNHTFYFTSQANTGRLTLKAKYAEEPIPAWFFSIRLRRIATPLDDPTLGEHPMVPILTSVDGVNPVDAILFMISMFYPDATYRRQSFLTARAKLEQDPPWRFRGLITNPGSSNTLLQRMAQQCKCLLWLNAYNEYDMMFLDDTRPVVMDFGDQWNIVKGSFSQTNNPPDAIYTTVIVYYDTMVGGSTNIADYRRYVFVTPTEGSSYGDVSALVAVMADTYAWTQRDNKLVFFADFVDQIYSAGQLLAWLVGRYGGHKDLCSWRTFVDPVPLRLGQLVQVAHPVIGDEPGTTMEGEVVRWEYEPSTTELALTARVLSLTPPTGDDAIHISIAITMDDVTFNSAPPGVFAATGQSGQFPDIGSAFQAHYLGKAPTSLSNGWQDLSDNIDDSLVYGTAVEYHGQTFVGSMPRTPDWQEDPLNTFVPATLWADGLQLLYDLGQTYGVFSSGVFSVSDLAYFGTLPRAIPYILGILGGSGTYGSASMDLPAQVGCQYVLTFYYKNVDAGGGADHSACSVQIGTPGNATLYANVALATGSMGDGVTWDAHTETFTATATTTRVTFRSQYATTACKSYFHHILLARSTLPVIVPTVDEGDDAGYLAGTWTVTGATISEDITEVVDAFTTSTPIASRTSPQIFALSDVDLTGVFLRHAAAQVSAIEEFQGRLYAALEASTIYASGTALSLWVTEDGVTWSFLRASITDFIGEDLEPVNKITSFCVFADAFWAAACHLTSGKCAVFRSVDGETWEEHEDFSATNGRIYQLATDGTTLFLGLGVVEPTGASKRAEVWRTDGTTWVLDQDLGSLGVDPTEFPCITALHWSPYHQCLIAGTGDPLDTQAAETEHNIRFYRRDTEGVWVLDEDFAAFDFNLAVVYDMAQGILLSG